MFHLFLNLGTLELGLLLMVGLAPLLLAIWALIDIFRRDFRQKTTDRLLIIILVVAAPFIGSIVYFLVLSNNYHRKLPSD